MDFSALRVHFNINVSDACGSLQFSEFQFVTKESFGLAHDGADDVLALDRSVYLNISANLVLHRLALLVAASAVRVVSFHVNVSVGINRPIPKEMGPWPHRFFGCCLGRILDCVKGRWMVVPAAPPFSMLSR